jgi:DNA-binding LytR/AlgR family response regulator
LLYGCGATEPPTLAGDGAHLRRPRFCQIHRSTIVNIDRIQAVESLFRSEYAVVLHDGTKPTSGRSYRRNLHAIMGKER